MNYTINENTEVEMENETQRHDVAKQLCRVAVDDYRYGEKAQMQALDSLANFLDIPFVVKTLQRMAGDDYTYGEKASMRALRILGKIL
ncbi:MAG: hypothetical protein ACE5GU_14770 [Candidatus Scalinduaceae bacterium]